MHRAHDLGGTVEVEFIPEYETGLPDDEPSEAVTAWLEQQAFTVTESGGTVLEHLIIPAEVALAEEAVVAVRDCHFLIARYFGPLDEAAA
ncbi:MAG TPA: hypothetical protein VHA37_09520 [Candidatus Saccharimonadales bacterium]|nr:hypothetical protein [Candidatus Saccharimonadales bacterium]